MNPLSELVDYLLFMDEAPLPGPVHGTSGFAEKFAAQGPFDSHGRSLRQLDLRTRLLRYPCSYMIYSQAFDSLPVQAKSAIYQRMWQILSGAEKGNQVRSPFPGRSSGHPRNPAGNEARTAELLPAHGPIGFTDKM